MLTGEKITIQKHINMKIKKELRKSLRELAALDSSAIPLSLLDQSTCVVRHFLQLGV